MDRVPCFVLDQWLCISVSLSVRSTRKVDVYLCIAVRALNSSSVCVCVCVSRSMRSSRSVACDSEARSVRGTRAVAVY
jgi:hypothetical protein